MIVLVGNLASAAGAGFAVPWHGSAGVSVRLVVATQVAVVSMVAVMGAFVVVVVCVQF